MAKSPDIGRCKLFSFVSQHVDNTDFLIGRMDRKFASLQLERVSVQERSPLAISEQRKRKKDVEDTSVTLSSAMSLE
eukprot:263679-Hanusia_phi.AAC.2